MRVEEVICCAVEREVERSIVMRKGRRGRVSNAIHCNAAAMRVQAGKVLKVGGSIPGAVPLCTT